MGGDIDGAWWPRTGSMVRELPDLVEALRPAIGEVIDIRLNWSAGSVTPMMSTMAAAAAAKFSVNSPRHRLMAFDGRNAGARILVVPAITSATLALMVLRFAGGRQMSDVDRASPVYERADRIVHAARAESSAWDAEHTGRNPAGASGMDEQT